MKEIFNVGLDYFLAKFYTDTITGVVRKTAFEFNKSGNLIKVKEGWNEYKEPLTEKYSKYSVTIKTYFDSRNRYIKISSIINKCEDDGDEVSYFYRIPLTKDNVVEDGLVISYNDVKYLYDSIGNSYNLTLDSLKRIFNIDCNNNGEHDLQSFLIDFFKYNTMLKLIENPNNLLYVSYDNIVYVKNVLQYNRILYKNGKRNLNLEICLKNINSQNLNYPIHKWYIRLLENKKDGTTTIWYSNEWGTNNSTFSTTNREHSKVSLYHIESGMFKDYKTNLYHYNTFCFSYHEVVRNLIADNLFYKGINDFLNSK